MSASINDIDQSTENTEIHIHDPIYAEFLVVRKFRVSHIPVVCCDTSVKCIGNMVGPSNTTFALMQIASVAKKASLARKT